MFVNFEPSGEEWPPDAEATYERIEQLGRGSFGTVWMGRRKVAPVDEYDDTFVALKNIQIKGEKSYVYASREICILRELRHPNVIRLIRAFDIWEETSQLVALQLARGPDLHYLVTNRGALGLPLARLVARHLVAAVSYLHGRAVIHRDIKPTNCILENTQIRPDRVYNWLSDDTIWSDGPDAERAVASNKWKLMLVDFGFARALGRDELDGDKQHRRNSIVNEHAMRIEEVAAIVKRELEDSEEIENCATKLRHDVETASPVIMTKKKRLSAVSTPIPDRSECDDVDVDEESSSDGEPADPEEAGPAQMLPPMPPSRTKRGSLPTEAASRENPDSLPGERRQPIMLRASLDRKSSARTKVRAMSALGTKAYAAPEIKHDLRNKTDDDINMSREALTECVADYGMIVDSFSVGWTLRVVLTGVPPTKTISSYLEKINTEDRLKKRRGIWMCCSPSVDERFNLRDTSDIPKEAAHLINALTKRNVEERMTVRESQSHPYIKGLPDEAPFELPVGDIPAKHGDPVVPLKCSLSLK